MKRVTKLYVENSVDEKVLKNFDKDLSNPVI